MTRIQINQTNLYKIKKQFHSTLNAKKQTKEIRFRAKETVYIKTSTFNEFQISIQTDNIQELIQHFYGSSENIISVALDGKHKSRGEIIDALTIMLRPETKEVMMKKNYFEIMKERFAKYNVVFL